jgi:serine-type anaerobic sulfatase-maturating enzyme
MARLLRQNRAPAELMADYARDDAARGRNAPCTCGSGRKWKQCHGEARAWASAPQG